MLHFRDEFEIVCPLGTKCHAAYFLKKNNLRQNALPFDWIRSDLYFINYCLDYGFELFFSNNYKKHKGGWINDDYKGGSIFFHKKPIENIDYFKRCILRFMNLLSCEKRKLFVLFFLNEQLNEKKIKQIKQFVINFDNFTSNYKLFCLFQKCEGVRKYNFFRNKKVDFLEIKTKSNTNGICFENDDDNKHLDQIFLRAYKFKLEYQKKKVL